MSHISIFEWLFLSEILTGFEIIDLRGTGLVERYFDTFNKHLKNDEAGDLLDLIKKLKTDSGHDKVLQQEFSGPLGATLRNIITLWYMGTWTTLQNGQPDPCIISGAAYREGLMWRAIAAHPMGAKQSGFGTWAEPPEPLRDTDR